VPGLPQTAHPDAGKSGAYAYVANCCGVLNNGDVTVYDSGLTSLEHRQTAGAAFPMTIAVDTAGTLYVLNESSDGPQGIAVTEYDRGSHTPARRIGGFYWATTLALDATNELYVANCNTCTSSGVRPRAQDSPTHDSVTVYLHKQIKPVRTITEGIHDPTALALDPAGDVYVANDPPSGGNLHPSVTVYAPQSTKLIKKITNQITRPMPLATDPSGDLFVIDARSEVIEYAPRSNSILRTITDGIQGAYALATDTSGTLYVANGAASSQRGWISIYAPGSETPEYEIFKGVNEPVALALDSVGDLYVANDGGSGSCITAPRYCGHVSVYAPGAQTPSRTRRSGRFGEPVALALGRY